MTIVDKIRSIAEEANPGYAFFYQHTKEMNRQAESVARDSGVAYMKEIRSGAFPVVGFQLHKSVNVVTSFFKCIDLNLETRNPDGTATYRTREDVIDELEREIVFGFCDILRERYGHLMQGNIQLAYPELPDFDCNEIAVQLSFTIMEPVC